ncbi:MAG: PD-(D/E)XK nuclease family protein [Geminicoccaceae bacterium]
MTTLKPSSRMIPTLSFRASSLSVYESCPRRFGANFLIDRKLDKNIGIEFRKPKNHIGSAIGSACHSGHAYLMNALMTTGDHGGVHRAKNAVDVSISAFTEIVKEGVGMDEVTKTLPAAEHSIERMVEKIFNDHRPDSEPVLVEEKLETIISVWPLPSSIKLTGTVDLYLLEKYLPDLKTGKNRPQAFAQMGTYSLILRANGLDVDRLGLVYVPRVPARQREQPSAEIIPINQSIAEKHALSVAKHAHRDVDAMMSTGDVEQMVANPSDRLCSPQFCPAFGTPFCAIGAATHPQKMERAS